MLSCKLTFAVPQVPNRQNHLKKPQKWPFSGIKYGCSPLNMSVSSY